VSDKLDHSSGCWRTLFENRLELEERRNADELC